MLDTSKIKIVLLTDLDNTIIHGERKYKPGDICVERDIDGKPITYMGKLSLGKLLMLQAKYEGILEIIPVTSRSKEMYLRIINTGILNFRYGFICNGACLMVGDKQYTEGEWNIKELDTGLEGFTSVLGEYVDRVRLVDGYYYFGKIKDSYNIDTLANQIGLGETDGGSRIFLQKAGRKMYLLTDKITKGNALRAVVDYSLMSGNQNIHIVCAGDSIMDIPMAKWSDTAIYSNNITKAELGSIRADIKLVSQENEGLAHAVLNEVYKLCLGVIK